MAGKTKNYTDEFKKQIVALRESGKAASEIAREYQIAKSTVVKWSNDYKGSGSFKAKDNRTETENELIQLRKENKQLLMENDILYPKGHAKQAALIMARK